MLVMVVAAGAVFAYVDAALAAAAAEAALVGARPMTGNACKVDLARTLIRRSIMQAVAAT